MSRAFQAVTITLPSASSTAGTPSDRVMWMGDYDCVSLIISYRAYDVGDYSIFIQTLARSDDGSGGYVDTWYDWSVFNVVQAAGQGFASIQMPFATINAGGLIGSGDTPAFAGPDSISAIPNAPTRAIAVSGAGITKGSAYCSLFFEGLRKKNK